MADDVATFLLARFDEDGAIAGAPGPVGWQLHRVKAPIEWRDDLGIDGESADTLVLDPARLTLEVEAKRQIVREVETIRTQRFATPGVGSLSLNYSLDRILRLLALPYADHPDYREEWRP